MIVKITRGGSAAGLLRYLVGPGRANEHETPHLVGGSAELMSWYSNETLNAQDAAAIAAALDAPMREHGTSITTRTKAGQQAGGGAEDRGGSLAVLDPETEHRKAAHIWHTSLSLPPTGPDPEHPEVGRQVLNDEQWEQVAAEFMADMGLAGEGVEDPCQFVAVHHGASKAGGDHIHLAVNLVTESGAKADVHQDYRRASKACEAIEQRHGLEVVAGRSEGRDQRAETYRELVDAERSNQAETYSAWLTRQLRSAAAGAGDEAEFVTRARQAGLILRPRFKTGDRNTVVGYAAAKAVPSGEHPEWRAGGKLGRDLSLPRLRQQFTAPQDPEGLAKLWQAAKGGPEAEPAPAPPQAVPTEKHWEQAAEQIGQLRERLRSVDPSDRAAWSHAAHEVSGVLSAWSTAVEGNQPGPLANAAAAMSRSAQTRAHVAARPTSRVPGLRGAALVVASLAVDPGSRTGQAMMLRNLLNTMKAINDVLVATTQAREAGRVAEAARKQLAQVAHTLPDVAARRAAAGQQTAPRPTRGRGATHNNEVER